jgi:CBS-domain-containing membrane protein
MFVQDVMTAHPVTVTVATSAKHALMLLDEYAVTSLPVVDRAGRIRGVVSEADLIRDRVPRDLRDQETDQEAPAAEPGPPPRVVEDVYTPHAVTVGLHDDLADAVELLTSTTVKSLPVVDRAGVVVGMLSRSDVVHLLARADSQIAAGVTELFTAFGHPDWLVEVDDGVVTVDGPSTVRERSLARATATTVAGVVGVQLG